MDVITFFPWVLKFWAFVIVLKDNAAVVNILNMPWPHKLHSNGARFAYGANIISIIRGSNVST